MTYPLPIANRGRRAAHPGSDLPTRAYHDHYFPGGPSNKFCPACQPRAYAEFSAKHRSDFTLNLSRGSFSPGQVVEGYKARRYCPAKQHVGIIGTESEATLAHLAGLFPEHIYFVTEEAFQ